MNNKELATIVETSLQYSPAQAEKELSSIADEYGDEKVLALLKEMSPLKVADILRNHDSAKTSLLFYLNDPAQKVNFLESEPLHWGDVDKYEEKELLELQEKITCLLLNMVGEDENKGELLKALEENPKTYNYLILPFCGWIPPEEMMIEGGDWSVAREDAEQGTNDHLFEIIRIHRPSLAKKIVKDDRRKQLLSEISAEIREEGIFDITQGSRAQMAFTPLKNL